MKIIIHVNIAPNADIAIIKMNALPGEVTFILIPKEHVKNGEERLVVLNRVAKSVVESLRGSHPTHVFVHTPKKKMNNTAWKPARERAAEKWAKRHGEPAADGFRRVRVHDLTHVRSSPESGRRYVRGPSGLARPPEWADHHALLTG